MMGRANAVQDSPSLLRAIDGSHLKWNEFRENVLQHFGITIVAPGNPDTVPLPVRSLLQKHMLDSHRFEQQRQTWRDQIAIGQGLTAATPIIPPHILPQVLFPRRTQRFLSPRLSRETLPRRPKLANCPFELPSSKSIYASAFTTEAFSEAEHLALPAALSPVGTAVNFSNGQVSTSKVLHCPFLVFEYCQSTDDEDIEKAFNLCAVSGAQCVKGLQDISLRANKAISVDIYTFSCVLNNTMATVNIHTANALGKYTMAALCKFDLATDAHFDLFQAWIETIEDWASHCLLPILKDLLTKLAHTGDTPPASPMPSLALSIDTEISTVPGLMQTLRRTYPTIPWHSDDPPESPINSSIAHCGTPAEGRRSQSLALSSPAATPFGNLMLRRGRGNSLISPISTRNVQLPFTPARPSPFSPRYSTNVTNIACDTIVESPCRPPTLSPFTPPPDQPWSAKSPVLVLQRRVDVAMDEVQELRAQVELLQSELAVKNQQLCERLSAMEMLQTLQEKQNDDRQRAKTVEHDQHLRLQVQTVQAITVQTHHPSRGYWIKLGVKYEGWEVLLEQLLFLIAVVALTGIVLMPQDLLLVFLANGPGLMKSKLINARHGLRWPVDISNYLSGWIGFQRHSE